MTVPSLTELHNIVNTRPSFYSGGLDDIIKASSLVNGDMADGGSAGATITRGLIGAEGSGVRTLDPFPNYLELYAKRSAELASKFESNCPAYFIQGNCEDGHRFAKVLYCGKEWCSNCGQEWSKPHQRRFSRWLCKVTQIQTMGYFVFTLPMEVRENFRSKKQLSWLGSAIQNLLKSYGYERGLRRWHFFGDKTNDWHPHLNVIVDGAYASESKLERIKQSYSALLGVEIADVNYRYRKSPGEKVHTLKYVTRATFKDYKWDLEMADELHGFRNQLWWGHKKWNEAPAWSLEDLDEKAQLELESLDSQAVESLENGECPHCHKPIEWGNVQPIGVLDEITNKRDLGGGYYELEQVEKPRAPALPPEDIRKLQRLKILQAALKTDVNRTYDGYHTRHAKFADQWELDYLADQEREALWANVTGGPAPEDKLVAPWGEGLNN